MIEEVSLGRYVRYSYEGRPYLGRIVHLFEDVGSTIWAQVIWLPANIQIRMHFKTKELEVLHPDDELMFILSQQGE